MRTSKTYSLSNFQIRDIVNRGPGAARPTPAPVLLRVEARPPPPPASRRLLCSHRPVLCLYGLRGLRTHIAVRGPGVRLCQTRVARVTHSGRGRGVTSGKISLFLVAHSTVLRRATSSPSVRPSVRGHTACFWAPNPVSTGCRRRSMTGFPVLRMSSLRGGAPDGTEVPVLTSQGSSVPATTVAAPACVPQPCSRALSPCPGRHLSPCPRRDGRGSG